MQENLNTFYSYFRAASVKFASYQVSFTIWGKWKQVI